MARIVRWADGRFLAIQEAIKEWETKKAKAGNDVASLQVGADADGKPCRAKTSRRDVLNNIPQTLAFHTKFFPIKALKTHVRLFSGYSIKIIVAT